MPIGDRGRVVTAWGAPTFLGRQDHALASWWHAPTDTVPADVVLLAPPIGREGVVSYRALRQLAALIAERGAGAVRFGWSGTGESAPLDPSLDAVANWRADLLALTDELRGQGAQRIHLVGLRSAALLIADTWRVAQPDWASVLLWDPVPSGRWFARYESTLLRGVPDVVVPEEPAFYAPGVVFGDADGRAIKGLSFQACPAPPRAGLIHRDGSDPEAILSVLGWPEADRWAAEHQIQLLEVDSMLAKSPVPDLRQIAAWFEFSGVADLHAPLWVPRSSAVITTATGSVREAFVSIGPDQLPGIVTLPLDPDTTSPDTTSPDTTGPAVLYLGGASEPKDGATALWTQVSRLLATKGRIGLRADRRGAGDAIQDFSRDEVNPYRAEALADVAAAAAWLTDYSGAPPDAVGMCAGAYLALEPDNAALFRQIVGFGLAAFVDVARLEQALRVPDDPEAALRELAARSTDRSVQTRVKQVLRSRMPYPIWRLLGRLSLVNSPDAILMASSAKSAISLVFGQADFDRLKRQRGIETLLRCQRAGHPVRVWVDPDFDHALLGPSSRRLASTYICAALFGMPSPRPEISPQRERGRRPRQSSGRSAGAANGDL